jgi:hypothetical protein
VFFIYAIDAGIDYEKGRRIFDGLFANIKTLFASAYILVGPHV